jgi:hypothetical protein
MVSSLRSGVDDESTRHAPAGRRHGRCDNVQRGQAGIQIGSQETSVCEIRPKRAATISNATRAGLSVRGRVVGSAADAGSAAPTVSAPVGARSPGSRRNGGYSERDGPDVRKRRIAPFANWLLAPR